MTQDSRPRMSGSFFWAMCQNMLDLYFSYVPFSERRCLWKWLCKWGPSCTWTLLARMLICCCAPAPPKMRLDEVGGVGEWFWLCMWVWVVSEFHLPSWMFHFPSWHMLVLRRVLYSYISCFLDFEFHCFLCRAWDPLAGRHRSDSLAHVRKSCNNLSQIWRCRAFWPMIWRERGRLDGFEREYLEMVGEILSLEFFGIWVGYAVGSRYKWRISMSLISQRVISFLKCD